MKKLVACCALLFMLMSATPKAAFPASGDIASRLSQVINGARMEKGLAPYALNERLTAAAQAHSDDLVHHGGNSAVLGHVGSDGSTPLVRIDRAGYPRAGGWGGEIWAEANSPEYAYGSSWQDAVHMGMILHPVLREFGLGITATSAGGFIFVVDFGAQPNTLPIFVNGGVSTSTSRSVSLTLTNETAIPGGDGPNRMGRAISVQVSGKPDFAGAAPQPFSPQLPYTLQEVGGVQTVYVKLTDAAGRSSISSASVALASVGGPAGAAPALPAVSLTPAWTASKTQLPSRPFAATAAATMTLAALAGAPSVLGPSPLPTAAGANSAPTATLTRLPTTSAPARPARTPTRVAPPPIARAAAQDILAPLARAEAVLIKGEPSALSGFAKVSLQETVPQSPLIEREMAAPFAQPGWLLWAGLVIGAVVAVSILSRGRRRSPRVR